MITHPTTAQNTRGMLSFAEGCPYPPRAAHQYLRVAKMHPWDREAEPKESLQQADRRRGRGDPMWTSFETLVLAEQQGWRHAKGTLFPLLGQGAHWHKAVM